MMRNRRISIVLLCGALAAASLAACVSQSTVETRQVTATVSIDQRRRAEAHTSLAAEYYQRGNFTVALAETRAAIAEDPTYGPAHNMQGLVYMQVREDGPAREAFERALRLEPSSADVLNNYGWFLCLHNEAPRAMEMLQRAANETRYVTPEKALLSAGLCMRRQGRDAEAEDYLRRAVLIRPDLIGALFNLAAIAYDRGAYKEAEGYITRYTRLTNPTLDGLVLGVKIARANNDRLSEESFLQQLRRLYPEDPQARALLGGTK
jgi:type IV pilus assembly protein PilF